ncbi:MAG TPA: fumarylacetoacetate hydrolase family protein [Rhodospirillales bacterium]|nr:MAG: Ureidoglycolate lyase [Alphaproteobacteria bacterium MarineAlpha3_Bin6]HHZ76876.1 fumarylacetoacetate hydrolase family protein [Rhodospirillales bacterium]HIB20940.1 fumarylacetoacetate hydrolase family protein [Rhodospirillales bacterium]HIO38203.1 fumarylacetoacetate hydrolase family protein [Rhodospirillales bacterium]
MKIGSYIYNGKASYGVKLDDGIVDLGRRLGKFYPDLPTLIKAFALGEAEEESRNQSPDFKEEDVYFLPLMPAPVNIYCAGINYLDHIEETGRDKPEFPTLFMKSQQSMIGHGQDLVRPKVSDQFDFEGEFAVVIGKPGRYIAKENWKDYIAGYTIIMDGSIRDFQKRSVDQGKNFYHSSSSGPWLITMDEVPGDFRDMKLTTRLNGKVMQASDLGKLCFDVSDLISYYSQIFYFQPGDMIATGTPGGVGSRRDPPVWMKPGDELEVEITGIGILKNAVVGEN